MIKTNCYELKYLNVAHKWMDGTKTTVELIYYDMFGQPVILAYVHTDDEIEVAKQKEEKIIDVMLGVIRNNLKSNSK